MKKQSFAVTATLILILIHALVWFAFTVLVALDLHPALPDSPAARWIMGVMAFGCACVLVALVLLLSKRYRPAYYLALGLLALLLILTVTDQVGWADVAYLILAAIPFVLLIEDRSWYLIK